MLGCTTYCWPAIGCYFELSSFRRYAGTAAAGFVHNCGNAHVSNKTAKYLEYFATSQALKAAALGASGNNASAVAFDHQPVAVSSPAPIRIFVEYQFGSSPLSASQRAQVQSLMASAVNIMQKFLYSKYPVDGNLLVAAYCARYNWAGTCTRYYPEFTAVNNADKSCGVASINPNHIAANPAHGCVPPGKPCDSYFYFYIRLCSRRFPERVLISDSFASWPTSFKGLGFQLWDCAGKTTGVHRTCAQTAAVRPQLRFWRGGTLPCLTLMP